MNRWLGGDARTELHDIRRTILPLLPGSGEEERRERYEKLPTRELFALLAFEGGVLRPAKEQR